MKLWHSAPLVAVALVITGCAAPGQGGASGRVPDRYYGTRPARVCNDAALSTAGALMCKSKGKIAACAAAEVAACYLDNSYKAEQVHSGQQIADEYIQRHGQLPEKALAAVYRSEVKPRDAVSSGQQVEITSTIVVVPCRVERGVMVEQELAIVDGTGETWGQSQRREVNPGISAGGFRTSFSFPVTSFLRRGAYTLRMTLYVNGAVVRRDESSMRIQIVQGPTDQANALVATHCCPVNDGGFKSEAQHPVQ